MIKGQKLHLTQGTHENKYRPSIDVLFRSAAVNFGHRSIGIILTGLFEDGTSGMLAINRCGGICIIQDPREAEFPDMPRSVLNKIEVDHQAGLSEIPQILLKILDDPLPPRKPIPRELVIEAEITDKMMTDMDTLKEIGKKSDFACPDCGGGLYEINNNPTHRYRCYTGHVYTEKLLQELQDKKIEESLWVSIRMLEEKENLMLLMARRDEGPEGEFSSRYDDRLANIKKHIERLKAFLMMLNQDLSQKENSQVNS